MEDRKNYDRGDVNQESQYALPYHYIPSFENGHFSQHLYWSWGYAYLGALEFVLSILSKETFENLVDIGCGDGRFLREVSERFPGKSLAGTDYSRHAIELARAMNPRLRYDCEDICDKKSPSETFDVATLIEVLEHIPVELAPAFIAATAQYLKPDGRLILTVPHSNHPVAAKHFQHFDSASLRTILEHHFEIERMWFIDKKSPILRRVFNVLLGNRFFILNNRPMLNLLFKFYRRHLFLCEESMCGRIFVKAFKK